MRELTKPGTLDDEEEAAAAVALGLCQRAETSGALASYPHGTVV